MKIPFIHDHHTHVSLYAALVDCLDIGHCPNHASVMKQFSSLTPDKLHIVLGWDSSRFALDEEDLASVAPVLVNDRSLHGFLLNAPARALLQSQYPDIVTKYRDVAFRERFVARIMQMLVAYAGVNEEKLKRFLALRRMEGISAVTEMLLTGESLWTIYDQLDSPPPLVCYTDPAIYLELSPPVRARISGIKLFADGSLGARTAALSEPYLDGTKGLLNYTDQQLAEQCDRSLSWGKMLSIHALGDLAIQQVVRVARDLVRAGISLAGSRIEHAQLIDRGSAHALKDLGFILSMQPNFATDSLDYRDRLSSALAARINPMRMLIDEIGFEPGKDLIFGSDGMPHGITAALSCALFPPLATQRLTLDECIAGYHGPASDEGSADITIDYDRGQVQLHEMMWRGRKVEGFQ